MINLIKKEKLEKEINDDKENRIRGIMFWIMVIVSIILFSFTIAPKTLQNDTFYTIKIGEYISQNGISNLTEDNYSWIDNLPYTYPHWLYDLCIFLIYNSFDQTGIYASTIILTAVLGISIYLNCKYKSKNKIISFIFTIIAMYLLRDYVAARAQLVTYCLFSFTVYFIEKFLNTHKKRYAVYLLIIPLLITNLHCAVFPFYFVLFLPYIAEYLLVLLMEKNIDYKLMKIGLQIIMKFVPSDATYEKLQQKVDNIPNAIEREKARREERNKNPYKIRLEKNPYVKWLIVIFIIAAFTGFINPAGTGAYTYTYKIYQGNTTASINEHQPLTIIDYKEYLFGLSLFLIIMLFTDTKIKLSDLLMVGGLVFLSLSSRRQVSMVLIFGIPILVRVLSEFISKYDKKTFDKLYKIVSSYAIVLIIILGFSVYSTQKYKNIRYNDYVSSSSYPVDAATWMLENLDVNSIKLYNEYNFGSYLLLRGIPVFIDSRCDLYTPEFNGRLDVFSDAINIASINVGYEDKFKEYGVTHLIMPNNAKLLLLIEKDENYNRIYKDSSFCIYEHVVDSSVEEDNE